jgi:PAS domain S-box-containing protein
MKRKGTPSSVPELRRRAEQRLRGQTAAEARPKTAQETLRLLHELQVHQVELEMQNEELVAARAEVEASLARYTDLYDFAPVGYFTLGPEGTIRQVNITGAGLLEIERSKLLRRALGGFVAPQASGQWDQHLQSVLQSATKETCELMCQRADGSTFFARLESIRLDRPAPAAGDGHPSAVIRVAMSDISDRKRAEEALHHLTAELERSNAELQHFAHIASHDLQEPLRIVIMFLKLLADRYKPQLDDKAREYIDYSVQGANQMSELIRDLLEYSRAGRMTQPLRPIDTALAVQRALANLRVAIQEGAAAVTYDALPTVRGDASQLMQLFQNLIGNALKFRSPQRPCRIHVGARKQGDQWQFSVKDNGIGIPQAAFDRIFVIFQRLHGREKYPGTGIGLGICKRVVERHGGKIWMESKVGEGSTFFFTLPKDRIERPDDAMPQSWPAASGVSLT